MKTHFGRIRKRLRFEDFAKGVFRAWAIAPRVRFEFIRSDAQALADDWVAVGRDMRIAIDQVPLRRLSDVPSDSFGELTRHYRAGPASGGAVSA